VKGTKHERQRVSDSRQNNKKHVATLFNLNYPKLTLPSELPLQYTINNTI